MSDNKKKRNKRVSLKPILWCNYGALEVCICQKKKAAIVSSWSKSTAGFHIPGSTYHIVGRLTVFFKHTSHAIGIKYNKKSFSFENCDTRCSRVHASLLTGKELVIYGLNNFINPIFTLVLNRAYLLIQGIVTASVIDD
jgi:hypothetical protein